MAFNIVDVYEALKIVKECKDTELHINTGDLKLSLCKGEVGNRSSSMENSFAPICQSSPVTFAEDSVASQEKVPTPVPAVEEKKVEAKPEDLAEEGLVLIKANVTSVFYRRPSPEEPPFVEVGDQVEADTVVCLLEVMKCFRQVTAEVRGTVEKICVENSELVQAGSVMFLVKPE